LKRESSWRERAGCAVRDISVTRVFSRAAEFTGVTRIFRRVWGLGPCFRGRVYESDSKSEGRDPKAEGLNPESGALELLTREELAVVLKVSLHTVDRMLAEEEIPCIKLRGWMVRFYMPEVIRVLWQRPRRASARGNGGRPA